MGLFGDNNKKTIAELEEYYANRQSNGMAWIMAFLSLLITVAVIAGLFFGGRWLYRTLTDNDNSATVSSTEEAPAGIRITSDDASNTTTNNDGVVEVTTEGNQDATVAVTEGVVTDEAARTDSSNADSESASSNVSVNGALGSSTDIESSTAASSNDGSSGDTATGVSVLPNTGASELLIAVPLLTVAIGYFISRHAQLRS